MMHTVHCYLEVLFLVFVSDFNTNLRATLHLVW